MNAQFWKGQTKRFSRNSHEEEKDANPTMQAFLAPCCSLITDTGKQQEASVRELGSGHRWSAAR